MATCNKFNVFVEHLCDKLHDDHAFLPRALAILPYGVAWLLDGWWPAGGLFTFFFQVAVVLPVAGAGAWFVGLTVSERLSYQAAIVRFLRPALTRMTAR